MKKLLCVLFLVLAVWTRVGAQQFPVQVNAQLAPPYSLVVSDYYSPVVSGTEKLKVILLNKDLQRTSLEVRLRLIIESQSVRIRTREDVVFTPITLLSGTPYYVSTADLAQYFKPENLEFSGLSQGEYEQGGKLPEGFYSFCLEAVEVQGGQTVSNRSCAFAWMTLSDPPFLNLPLKAESLTPRNPQNIVFHWTPRHTASVNASFSTDYIFSIAEILDSTIAPEAAFTTNPVLYSENVGSVTTFLYDAGKPQLVPGHRYAWRVQAVGRSGAEGLAAFKNNGYSETWWFTYQSTCAAPVGIAATLQGQSVVVSWQTNPQHLEYRLEYREKNEAEAEWFVKTNTLPTITLSDLKPGTQYEYRVGGSCEEGVYTFSDLLSFTTNAANVSTVPNCGDSSSIPGNVQQNLLQILRPGESFKAGDFTVVVTECGAGSSFTGKGYVTVPWLMNMKVAVQFNGITINTDKQLITGRIETPYDPTEGGIGDVDEYIDAYVGGNEVGRVISGLPSAEQAVNFLVQMPGGIQASFGAGYDSTTGKGPVTLTFTPVGGGTTQTLSVDHLPTTVQDGGGTIYQVDKNGTVSTIGKAGGDALLSKTNKSHVDTDKGTVQFVDYPEKQVYAFDAWRKEYKQSGAFNKKYERLNDDYYVSAKAIAPGKTDYLKAVVTLKDNTLSADSILFVSGKGTIYERTKKAEGVYEIAVVGGPEKDAQEIYALYKQAGGKTLNLGKVLVASYPKKEFKVKLVPVNGASIDQNSIQNGLNEVYSKINVFFNVEVESNFQNTTWDLNGDGWLQITGSSMFSTLTSEMKALNKVYAESNTLDNSIYLFVLEKANLSNAEGDMPRGKRFGYLFNLSTTQIGRTSAHEIGHGQFKLSHLTDGYGFSELELSDNLMTGGSGKSLSKYQWDLIHDPVLLLSPFDKDEEAMSLTVSDLTEIKNTFKNSKNALSFLSPSGKRVSIDIDELQEVTFSTGDQWISGSEPVNFFSALGVLDRFKIQRNGSVISYKGVGEGEGVNGRFKGYVKEGTTDSLYIDNISYQLKQTVLMATEINSPSYYDSKVLIGFPCAKDYNFFIKLKPVSYKSEIDIEYPIEQFPQAGKLIYQISDINKLPFESNFETLFKINIDKQIVIPGSSGFKTQAAKNYVSENCNWGSEDLYKTIQVWKHAELIDRYPAVCEECLLLQDWITSINSPLHHGVNSSNCPNDDVSNPKMFFELENEQSNTFQYESINKKFIDKAIKLTRLNEIYTNFSTYYNNAKLNNKLPDLIADISEFECLLNRIEIRDRITLLEFLINSGRSLGIEKSSDIAARLITSALTIDDQNSILNKLRDNNYALILKFIDNYTLNESTAFVNAVGYLAKQVLTVPPEEPLPSDVEMRQAAISGISKNIFPFTLERVIPPSLEARYNGTQWEMFSHAGGLFTFKSGAGRQFFDFVTLYSITDIIDCNGKVIWPANQRKVVTILEAAYIAKIIESDYRNFRAYSYLSNTISTLSKVLIVVPPVTGSTTLAGKVLSTIYLSGWAINIIDLAFEPFKTAIQATGDPEFYEVMNSWNEVVKYSNYISIGAAGTQLAGSLSRIAFDNVRKFVQASSKFFESSPQKLSLFYDKLKQVYGNEKSVSIMYQLRLSYERFKNILKAKSQIIEKVDLSKVTLKRVIEGADDWRMAFYDDIPLGDVIVSDAGLTLELDIIVPSSIQKSGILDEIFKIALAEFNPSSIKCTWKVDPIKYAEWGGKSVNLTEFIRLGGLSGNKIEAAFGTPSGKLIQRLGFTKTPEFIQPPTEEFVQVLFSK